MSGQFEIVYCQLSDGTPCANWAWKGKTPQAVAVLERRGTRTGRIKTMHHRGHRPKRAIRRNRWPEHYWAWTMLLRAEQAYIKAIVAEAVRP